MFQIYITVAQIAFGIIQTVIFTIGFSRAFASIRRKMMLNILMQVLLSQPSPVIPQRSRQHAQDMGFFEVRDSSELIGRLSGQVHFARCRLSLHLSVALRFRAWGLWSRLFPQCLQWCTALSCLPIFYFLKLALLHLRL